MSRVVQRWPATPVRRPGTPYDHRGSKGVSMRPRRVTRLVVPAMVSMMAIAVTATPGFAAATTTRLSSNTLGRPSNGTNDLPGVSDDCRLVAFTSNANDLVPQDTTFTSDIFLRDRATG